MQVHSFYLSLCSIGWIYILDAHMIRATSLVTAFFSFSLPFPRIAGS